jgi:NNP family nitrate/nitrite transporter-like MFS transporter
VDCVVLESGLPEATKSNRSQALTFSTIAFTACFAVWTIFSIIGVEIQRELGLSGAQF